MKRALIAALSFVAASSPLAHAAPGDDDADAKMRELIGRPGGLTADEVAKRAVTTSFDVAQRSAELDAAEASVDQATAAYIPRVTGRMALARQNEVDINFGGFELVFLDHQYDFSAEVSVPVSDYLLRLTQAHDAATHSRDAAELTRKSAALKAGADARIAYYSWVRARLAVVIAEQALVQAQQHRIDAKNSFDAGSATKADVLRVEAEVAQGDLGVSRAQHAAQSAEENLRIVMHDPESQFAIGEDINAEPALPDHADTLDELYREAIQKRPELGALDESREALLEQEKAAHAGYYPRLDLVGQVLYSNPNPRFFPPADKFDFSWAATLNLTWNLNEIFTTDAQVHGAEANVARTTAQRGTIIDGLEQEVEQSYLALRDALAAGESTARELAAAAEALRVRRELFRNGHATSTELTDAETELTRARIDALDAKIDLRVAKVRLEHALGRDDK